MVVGRNIEDSEQGKRGDLTYNFWVTDISKNSVLILNVSPKTDGTIPEKAQHILLGMGCWLSVNGKAICGTTPWIVAGEGPTKLEHEGAFSDGERLQYTAKDLRHVLNGDTLYAIMLGLARTRDVAGRSHAVDLSG